MPRHIRADEAAVVEWMLTHASLIGPLHHLLARVSTLRVFDRCRCGCSSVDFASHRHGVRYRPIGDAVGRTPQGEWTNVLLWGTADTVSALEVIGPASGVSSLPSVDSLQPAVLF